MTAWPTAFVFGGGSGIGLRLAEILQARGAAVSIFDLKIGEEAERRLGAVGSRTGGGPVAAFHEVDVTDSAAVARAIEAAVATAGPPALAINSAGVQNSKPFEDLSEDQFRRVVEVNLIGSRNFAAAVLPQMRAGAQLALVASLAGILPNHGYAAYSASKFGVIGLAGALRLEYKPKGITVSVICPPEVETPMVDEERRTGDAIGLEMKKFSGTLTVDQACAEIIRGLEARRWMIIPGRRARLSRRLAQTLPGFTNATSDRMVKRALKAQKSL